MTFQEFDQEEWEDSFVRSHEVRFIEFVTSEKTIKSVSWFVIGGILAHLAIYQLLTEHGVPIKLLFLLFLGQGLFSFGVYYLKQ